MNNHYLGL